MVFGNFLNFIRKYNKSLELNLDKIGVIRQMLEVNLS